MGCTFFLASNATLPKVDHTLAQNTREKILGVKYLRGNGDKDKGKWRGWGELTKIKYV